MKQFWAGLVYRFTIAPKMRRIKKLLPDASIYPAGSRYVCNPPSMNTDVDFLVYAEEPVDEILLRAGYVKSDFHAYFGQSVDDFWAWRCGVVNLIVTQNTSYRDSFRVATSICKTYNVLDKSARVIIHEILRGQEVNIGYFVGSAYEEVYDLVLRFTGQYRHAMIKAYMAQHDL